MDITKKLETLSKKLNEKSKVDLSKVDVLLNAALEIGHSFSGSWLGYHSHVYYHDFKKPPTSAHFSSEWGFDNMALMVHMGSIGDWKQYTDNEVIDRINDEAKNVNITELVDYSSEVRATIKDVQDEVLSLSQMQGFKKDEFSNKMLSEILDAKPLTQRDFIDYYGPKQLVSRDARAIEGGRQTPPHFFILTECLSVKNPIDLCSELSKKLVKLANHISNQGEIISVENLINNHIFIGHGHSQVWRELKDFISDRLHLTWDEFNRIPVAGVTNVSRLSEMLNHASFAFLIMTAEDETPNGKMNARQNVIHEAGLFQGKLGFDKAIILLEEGCEEFSNIHGLGQIRFAKGNLKSTFEEVRQVLERAGLLKELIKE
jgi:predicted nucleotide-binding protein